MHAFFKIIAFGDKNKITKLCGWNGKMTKQSLVRSTPPPREAPCSLELRAFNLS